MVAALLGVLMTALLFFCLALLIDRRGPISEGMQLRQAAKAKRSRRMGPRKLTAVMHRKTVAASITRAQPRKAKKLEKPKPDKAPSGRIVQTAKPEVEKAPKNAKYLGRYDMTVPVEQKSRGRRRRGQDLGRRQIDKPSQLQSPTSKSLKPTRTAHRNKRAHKRKLRKRATKTSGDAALLPGPKRAADGKALRKGAGALPGGGSPLKKRPRPSVVRGEHAQMLLPATSPGNIAHNLQALSGSPGSSDALREVHKEGPKTLLNTRSFRYYGYFRRVVRTYDSSWRAAEVMYARDPSGKRYGVRDRLSVVHVRLNGEGSLVAAHLAKASGLRFLDDEALRAVRAAGVIPNPPAGITNERGEVVFNFEFLLEMGTPKFRFYRANN
jgi:TonB family protein